jgi:peptide/nickel transport system substrate-binding protein
MFSPSQKAIRCQNYTTGPDPDSHLFSNYHSARIPAAANDGAGANYSRYINANVDAWLDQAAATIDMTARTETYCNVAAQINDDLPRIFLYERMYVKNLGYKPIL